MTLKVLKTYPWINATAISKKNRTKPPTIIKITPWIEIFPPLISLISKCPATILAANRTERVIGRIKFLTSSIKTMRGISILGVPAGTKWLRNLLKALKK